MEQPLGHRIDHHVAGAGIKGNNLVRGGICRNGREIGNAADVLHDSANFRVAIEQVIEKGNQGRAFAASGHVRRTKIADHRSSDPGRDDRALAGLPGRRDLRPRKGGSP